MKKRSIKIGGVELIPTNPEVPKDSVWDVKWTIKERPNPKKNELKNIGELWFSGAPERGVVAMNFSVAPEFKMSPIIKDVLRAMVDWAFSYRNVYEVTITTPTGDYYRTDAIERAGFVFRAGNKEEEHYSVVKPKTIWLGIYMLIGFLAGFLMGILFNSLFIGMGIGLIVGVLMGAVLDSKAVKERTDVTGKSENIKRRGKK